MKKRTCLSTAIVTLFFCCIFGCPAFAESDKFAEYTIGAGDILDISVWKNSELSVEVPVLPDGSVTFPLVGKINAEGKTLSEIQESLTQELIKYIPNPSLFILIKKINIPIYVIGKVNKPGTFNLYRNTSVLQSLTLAGGLNKFADMNDISIMREKDGNTELLKFNYEEVLEGKNLEQNIILQRGDTVIVR